MKDNELLVNIGKHLKRLRQKAGFTSQVEFAESNDIPYNTYCRMERGEGSTLTSLNRVLNVHKISMADFFDGMENYTN